MSSRSPNPARRSDRSEEPLVEALRGQLSQQPQAAVCVAETILQAVRSGSPADYLQRVLELAAKTLGTPYALVARFRTGRFVTLAETGTQTPLPLDLLADTLDREQPLENADWATVPLGRKGTTTELFVARKSPTAAKHLLPTLAALAPAVTLGLEQLRAREHAQRRIDRLEAILDIAGHWYQTHEMEPLLVHMAEAATTLLEADRASIFLWDRANRMLVGRPALGVEGGELRVPDDTGIVGRVVQGGQPMRVDVESDPALIDRRVDTDLGYQTRTLLCVPLRSKSGELFGAFETINKLSGNFTDEDQEALVELAAHAAIALENTQELQRLLESRRQMSRQAAQSVQLVGNSPPIEALRSTIRRVADTDLAVLVLGENGTGKEVVSQSIHYLSSRSDHPFIAVNCAALAESLLESELFGHEQGAFTDARESRVGKFELASGGTLFLDEIGDLSPGGQAKLLRVLEEKVVVRVGGSKSIPTDTRVIAATNQDLAAMVRDRRFRQDLYFRLNVVTLQLPALRERSEDILPLAEHFLVTFCRQARRAVPKLSEGARRRLETHAWPGNVRELRNVMERLAYLNSGERIEAEDLAFMVSTASDSLGDIAGDLPLTDATQQFQTRYIEQAIRRAGGNMSRAAEQMGLHRSNLYRKMRQLGMQVDE